MIVWIASYPRSGNTLARTVLFQTMGYQSYTRDFDVKLREMSAEEAKAFEFFGREAQQFTCWSEFYKYARESDKLFLIKTHLPPCDEAPVIHVVRDGRQACISYFHFLNDKFPEAQKTLLDVVAGNDQYTHWSRHYGEWVGQKNRLMVRYEDLIEPSSEILQQIASFVGFEGELGSWKNPFSKLRKFAPAFFRRGKNERTYPPEWNEGVELLFQHFHGYLNRGLGYPELEKRPQMTEGIFQELAGFIDRTGMQIRHLQKMVSEGEG